MPLPVPVARGGARGSSQAEWCAPRCPAGRRLRVPTRGKGAPEPKPPRWRHTMSQAIPPGNGPGTQGSAPSRDLRGPVVFLTLDQVGDFVIDDDMALPALEALGWPVVVRPWKEMVREAAQGPLPTPSPALVVIRSTWDYHHVPQLFLEGMEALERRGLLLENSLPLVRWNLDKRYLRELEERGVPIVPTLWRDHGLEPGDLAGAARHFRAGEMIVKPVVGASAEDTLRIRVEDIPRREEEALELFRGRSAQLQPFVPAVVEEGEYSLVYFSGRYSHTLLKTPVAGDFRVQEEYGSALTTVEPGALLRAAAERVLEAIPIPETPLYARVDLVRWREAWVLMELELIEPSLYLRMEEGAPARFAAAVDARIRERGRVE